MWAHFLPPVSRISHNVFLSSPVTLACPREVELEDEAQRQRSSGDGDKVTRLAKISAIHSYRAAGELPPVADSSDYHQRETCWKSFSESLL